VADPEPGTVAGLKAPQLRPLGKGVSDRVTVPAKPPTAATMTVDVADPPTSTVGEDAPMLKSWTVTVVWPWLGSRIESPA
jgi:hypothetical protein